MGYRVTSGLCAGTCDSKHWECREGWCRRHAQPPAINRACKDRCDMEHAKCVNAGPTGRIPVPSIKGESNRGGGW